MTILVFALLCSSVVVLTCAAGVSIVTWGALVAVLPAVVGAAVAVARSSTAGVQGGARVTATHWGHKTATRGT